MKILTTIILLFIFFSFNNLFAQIVCNQCAIANPINNGLIACYPFSGNTLDQSGNNNHGTNNGATLTTDRFGNPNSAYSFNGSSYISVPNSSSLSSPTSNITIAFWTKTKSWYAESGYNFAPVLCKSNSSTSCHYRVTLMDNAINCIMNNKQWYYLNGTNNLHQWDFYAVTISGNVLSYYKNGVLSGQSTSPAAFSLSTNNPLYIGRDNAGTIDYFSGIIDDIRIYNRVLSYSEVVTLFDYQATLNANAGLDKSICYGDSVQLIASGGPKFRWDNALYLSNDTISNPVTRTTITRDYILTITDGLCEDADTVKVNVITVNPDAGINKNICIGDSVQLNASGGTKYAWLTNNTLSDTSIYNPIAKPINSTKYYVLVSNGICKQEIDSVEVFITNNLITNAGKDTSICKNDSIQLQGVGGSSFTWSPSYGLSQSNISNPFASPQTTTQYILKSTSGNCSSEDTMVVTVNENPTLDLGLDKTVCKGETYTLNTISNANKFVWNPSYFLDNNLIKNPKIIPDSSIIYTVKAENSLTNCYTIDTFAIKVNKPIAKFIANPTSGHSPLSILFNNISLPINLTHLWDFGNQENSNFLNPKTTFTKAGKYIVKLLVTDSIGCKDSTFEEINVYDNLILNIPNVFTPNNDNVNEIFNIIISDSSQIKHIKGTIWNRWGGLIYEFNYLESIGWDGTYNGNNCSEGVYFYIFQVTTMNNETLNFHGTVTLLR